MIASDVKEVEMLKDLLIKNFPINLTKKLPSPYYVDSTVLKKIAGIILNSLMFY